MGEIEDKTGLKISKTFKFFWFIERQVLKIKYFFNGLKIKINNHYIKN